MLLQEQGGQADTRTQKGKEAKMKNDIRILLIEHNELVRYGLRRILEPEVDIEIVGDYANAEKALSQLKIFSPDIVLMDTQLSGMNGIEATRHLKRNGLDYNGDVIMLAESVDYRVEALEAGAAGYLLKDMTCAELTQAIREVYCNKQSRDDSDSMKKRRLEQKVEEQAKSIHTLFLHAITALAYALEAKDRYTNGHSQRVAETCVVIAGELGLKRHIIKKIMLGGLIHDIGKIGVRESVLNKPGGLTDEEYQHIKSHCEIGEHILSPVVEDEEILQIVRHHHERYDGTGYPDGLCGEQIALGARILAVADTYDAMISERPYRKTISAETACLEIECSSGTQLDPEVITAFFRTRKSLSPTVRCQHI